MLFMQAVILYICTYATLAKNVIKTNECETPLNYIQIKLSRSLRQPQHGVKCLSKGVWVYSSIFPPQVNFFQKETVLRRHCQARPGQLLNDLADIWLVSMTNSITGSLFFPSHCIFLHVRISTPPVLIDVVSMQQTEVLFVSLHVVRVENNIIVIYHLRSTPRISQTD